MGLPEPSRTGTAAALPSPGPALFPRLEFPLPSPARRPRVVAVMPARNVARTVRATFERIPKGCVDEVILVDNRSRDDTVTIAEALGIRVVRHETDRGFGGSLKTCLTSALAMDADLVLELHPDNQYPAELIPALLERADRPDCGVVIGSRFLPPRRALEGGMPLWKYVSNRCLSRLNGWLLGSELSEFHSGFRVYNAAFLRRVPYQRNSDDFVFGFEILAQALEAGYRLIEVPASCRYFAEASSNDLPGSIHYGLGTLRVSLRFRLQKRGKPSPPAGDGTGSREETPNPLGPSRVE